MIERATISVEDLIRANRSNGLLIDTNLLVLLIVGKIDRGLIRQYERAQSYSGEDFDRVTRIWREFSRIVATPNILTETDNLGKKLKGKYRQSFLNLLSGVISELVEEYIDSLSATKTKVFLKLGLSDSALLNCKSRPLILTDDFDLYGSALAAGLSAININHLRYSWR